MTLINIDPLNPANTAEPDFIKALGFTGVRFVSRSVQNPNDPSQFAPDPQVTDVKNAFQAANLFTLCVVTEQSNGVLIPDCDLYEIGNEPNVPGTRDTKPPWSFAGYLQLYRQTYPNLSMITGGILDAKIDNQTAADYIAQVASYQGLLNFQGVGIHYPRNKSSIQSILSKSAGLLGFITEWWVDPTTPNFPTPIFANKLMFRQLNIALDAWFSLGYSKWALTPAQARALRATN